MEQENFEQWDTDELYMWFTTEHDLMPDEEKLKASGIDGTGNLARRLENQMNLINVMSQSLTAERSKQSNPQ